MDSILKFAADNQVLLIIIAVILVLALIGYLTESKKFHDEDKAAQIRGVNQPNVMVQNNAEESVNAPQNTAVDNTGANNNGIQSESAKETEEKPEVL